MQEADLVMYSHTAKAVKRKTEDKAANLKAYNAVKAMTKDQVMKLKPGTWIETKWLDAHNIVTLLLEKPVWQKGEVWLRCFYPDRGEIDRRAVHSQVVRVLGHLIVPYINTPDTEA